MAASSRLPATLLGIAVVILALLAWKPWRSPRLSAPADVTGEVMLGTAPRAQGADTAPIGLAPRSALHRQQSAIAEQVRSAAPQAQPPQSYKGPDGKQHDIVYNQGLALSASAREELKRQRLQQMREQPEAIAKIYGMGRDEIAAVLAGKRPFPDRLIDQ